MSGRAEHRVLVAAGSNIEPVRNLGLAAREIARAFPGAAFSSAYRNAAVGFDGPDYINYVAAFDTTLKPREVVDRLHAIEALCGRPRHAPKWAPRSMDLDLLLYGDVVMDETGLELPRPDLLRRAYMLGPAAELAPTLVHPTLGVTLHDLWSRFDRSAHAMEQVPLDLAES